MADPFNEPLPNQGDKPWSLNPVIEEVRSRISDVDDVIETGRLSPEGLSDELVSLAAELNPEVLSDSFISSQIEDPGSQTSIALNETVADAVYAGLFPTQAASSGVGKDSFGVAVDQVAALPSRGVTVIDSVHEWWCWPIAKHIKSKRTTYGSGYSSNGEVLAWDKHDRKKDADVYVIGDAGTGGPGGEIDDHDAPARWVSDDGGFSVQFWQNHGDTDFFSVRVSLDGTARGFLANPEVQVVVAPGAQVSYTEVELDSISGDNYTFRVFTRAASGWPIKVVTVNRVTGAVTPGALQRTVTINGDQPYVIIAPKQGRTIRFAAYVNPAFNVHAIWMFSINLDTNIMTNVVDGTTHDITSGSYLDISATAPLVPETATTNQSRRLYYPHPTENRVLYSEWTRGSEHLAEYREGRITNGTFSARILGPAAGPRNGYTAAANYNPGAAYSPDGSLIATLHNSNTTTGGEVWIHTSLQSWKTQTTSYRLSRPVFFSNDELGLLAVDHYTDYFNYLMHQVSIVGFPVLEQGPSVMHPVASSTGAMWLIDPAWPTLPWPSGMPATNATVPNLATYANATISNTITSGVNERTSKGAIHTAASLSASGNQSFTVSDPAARDAIVAALAANHDVAYVEVYRVTREPAGSYAPTTGTHRFGGIITSTSGDYASIRVSSTKQVQGYPTASVVSQRQGTTLTATGTQSVVSQIKGPAGTPGTSNALLVQHNGGANSPAPARITYLSYAEDMTVSGRTYTQVLAAVDAWVSSAFGTGGYFNGDTWTTP